MRAPNQATTRGSQSRTAAGYGFEDRSSGRDRRRLNNRAAGPAGGIPERVSGASNDQQPGPSPPRARGGDLGAGDERRRGGCSGKARQSTPRICTTSPLPCGTPRGRPRTGRRRSVAPRAARPRAAGRRPPSRRHRADVPAPEIVAPRHDRAARRARRSPPPREPHSWPQPGPWRSRPRPHHDRARARLWLLRRDAGSRSPGRAACRIREPSRELGVGRRDLLGHDHGPRIDHEAAHLLGVDGRQPNDGPFVPEV